MLNPKWFLVHLHSSTVGLIPKNIDMWDLSGPDPCCIRCRDGVRHDIDVLSLLGLKDDFGSFYVFGIGI
jgi:hypothetical protein